MKSRHRLLVAALLLAALLVSGLASAQEVAGSDTSAFQRALAQGPAVAIAACFGIGLLASFTPCVYPMIIITVSIFGAKEAKSRLQAAALSGTFVLGIVSLFAPLGVLSAVSGKMLGSAMANPWVVGFIAVVFLALAASMFGAFEMTLPGSVQNKLSSVGGVGFKGAFALGMVCALIAAPCTGPGLTGVAMWIATTGDLVLGVAAMTSFALGLGVLFFVVGTFAVSLPKGGAWMLGIKWVCGVALAYMALAYVRDVMPSLQALVSPQVTYGIVGGAILGLGLVFALVHLAAERRRSPIAHLSKPMKLASILPAVVGVFMFVSWVQLPPAAAEGASAAGEAPHITWLADEKAGREAAAAGAKPVIVDFGASWCGACKELEHKTFPEASVRKEATRYTAIRVDATDDEDPNVVALQAKYGVKGLPTVILLDSTGKEAARFNEFVPADNFAKALASVK
ncbi:protein-disulfide reductase DsbD family protein [Chondromyces apiculatus]|uniref:Cytochrome c-type biogenesis protein DsbD, protein-disulfide reductase n=1 Tax=Chondromyces apiculatus DSM 436 TaxID=1192034 RepID=A0A017TDR3_9BACT|nr:cytochrome c biogenesis protein CcdA [Chondromyces apiculatus]EYF06950.1 Cytochrome c-type biogenesis protein DsbD, protein-disulfide reductase [Chondromyces apiculatus DSM 436]